MIIRLNNIVGTSNCEFRRLDGKTLLSCADSFPQVNAVLESAKVYGVISDIGDGSWGLVNTISGHGHLINGTISLNNSVVEDSFLAKESCSIGMLPDRCSKRSSMRSYIEKYLDKNKIDFSLQDLQQMFSISDARIDRALCGIGIEIWKFSFLAGFLQSKKIFSFPWLNSNHLFWNMDFSLIFDTIKSFAGIILIPTYQFERVSSICDEIIDLRTNK